MGLTLSFGTWIALRRLVGARYAPNLASLLLDALPTTLGFALFLMALGRPILAGLAIAAIGFGLGLTDRMKRHILREPVVFADRAELLDLVRHPRFYIAFVGTVRMVIGTLALVALIVGLLRAEPSIWHVGTLASVALLILAALIGRLAFVVPSRERYCGRLAARYKQWNVTRDPDRDAQRFGLVASLVIQATIARAERSHRQKDVNATPLPTLSEAQGPLILWQAESFVDVDRLAGSGEARLRNFARLKREAKLSGRFEVPAWGANTIRTELAAISGIGPEALGLDWYNPYEAFARVPLPSLARVAREAGYKTICVHPYSRTFYGRDKVMPLFGFDRFIGMEAFVDAETDSGYVTDRALAIFIANLIADEGRKLFVFAISIENHGPWDAKHDGRAPAQLPVSWAGFEDRAELGRWLRHIEATDQAFGILRETIERAGSGWLGVYGDHQPSLKGPFRPGDSATDYLLWQTGETVGHCRDLSAEDLARTWLELMQRG